MINISFDVKITFPKSILNRISVHVLKKGCLSITEEGTEDLFLHLTLNSIDK